MRISYDSKADAVYIKLIPGHHQVETKLLEDWVALDFDESQRLVGIEVLDASERLELSSLLPIDVNGDLSAVVATDEHSGAKAPTAWEKLRPELLRRKGALLPVETPKQHCKNWVEEVADEYVTVRRDESGNTCKITRREFEHATKTLLKKKRKWSITSALRELASAL